MTPCTCGRYNGNRPCPICTRKAWKAELEREGERRPFPFCKGQGRPNKKDCTKADHLPCDCLPMTEFADDRRGTQK